MALHRIALAPFAWGTLACLVLSGCGGPDLGATLPGVYVLDRAALQVAAYDRRALEVAESMAQAAPAERRAMERTMRAAARRESRGAALRLELRADGRFGVSYRYGKEEGASAGTWAVAGDRVRLTTTHERGRALELPYDQEARLDDGTLRLAGRGVPRPFSLVRARSQRTD